MSPEKKFAISAVVIIALTVVIYTIILLSFEKSFKDILEGKSLCSDGTLVPEECIKECGMPGLQACIEYETRPSP